MYIWTVKHSLKAVAYLVSISPGYKACARLYPYGDGAGKDSHVSLYIALMKGSFDAILPWPFTHQVTMLLLDQSGQGCHVQEKFKPDRLSPSFQQPRSEMNIATGCPRFISKTELERRKTLYMKENTMFIQIIVEWLDVITRISWHFVKYPIHACSQRFTLGWPCCTLGSLMWDKMIIRKRWNMVQTHVHINNEQNILIESYAATGCCRFIDE